jgi:hypothetical protein
MKGVTILDRDPSSGVLSFDLKDILSVLGDDAERSTWTVRDVECLGGDAATALHHASDAREVLGGNRLADLARDVGQIIDGEFSARLPNEEAPWIMIRAVDSSAFDVETDREDVLAALKAKFDRVEDLPV